MGKKKKTKLPTLRDQIVAALGYDGKYSVVLRTFNLMKVRRDLPTYSPSAIYRYLSGRSSGSTELIEALMDLAGLSVVAQ